MTVAFDVGPVRAQPAGVGLYATALANALAEAMPDSLALIGRRADAAGLPGAIPARERSVRVPYPAWVQLQSALDAKALHAEIVHYSDGLAPIVRHGRTVLAVHDMSVVRQRRTHSWRRYARIPFALIAPHLADVVVVPSRATADEVMALCGLPASRIEVIPYAPQRNLQPSPDEALAATLPRHGLRPGGYVLSLGTIEPRKNHLRLIAAFEQLAEDAEIPDDALLVIAGQPGWAHASVTEAIRRSPVANRIRTLGYAPADDLADLLTGAAVVAYVSLYEGFGLPVVEALACGAAVVTSNCSSMPEVAGDAGFLVDPYDPTDIARGLRAAFEAVTGGPGQVRERSLAQARGFSWAASAAALVELYASIASVRSSDRTKDSQPRADPQVPGGPQRPAGTS